MALGLRGKPEGEGRGFEWNVCGYTQQNRCLNKAGGVRADLRAWISSGGSWDCQGLGEGTGGQQREGLSSDGSAGPGSHPHGTPRMSPAAGAGPQPPAELSPQAKPRLSAELMGLGQIMLTNRRARPNARD